MVSCIFALAVRIALKFKLKLKYCIQEQELAIKHSANIHQGTIP